MTRRAPYFRLVSLAAIAAAIAACAEQEAESPDVRTQVAAEETPQERVTEPVETRQEEPSPETESAAEGPFLRAANFYGLQWRGDEALCADALATLNKPYRGASDAQGYAQSQAARMLGTEKNIRWGAGDAMPGVKSVEIAELDYFNDGSSHQIVRLHSRLSGSDVISLGVVETEGAAPTLFSFGHAGANTENFSAQDNLHTQLTYSVADVVRIGGGNYTLVAPLEDIDASGRAYLMKWHAKEGRSSPFKADDYYPAFACVFQPANPDQ